MLFLVPFAFASLVTVATAAKHPPAALQFEKPGCVRGHGSVDFSIDYTDSSGRSQRADYSVPEHAVFSFACVEEQLGRKTAYVTFQWDQDVLSLTLATDTVTDGRWRRTPDKPGVSDVLSLRHLSYVYYTDTGRFPDSYHKCQRQQVQQEWEADVYRSQRSPDGAFNFASIQLPEVHIRNMNLALEISSALEQHPIGREAIKAGNHWSRYCTCAIN